MPALFCLGAALAVPVEAAYAQQPAVVFTGRHPTSPLSETEAETVALANQPRLRAAQYRRDAAQQRVAEARSAFYPSATFNTTGARVADTGTTTAAGALTTSSLSDRFAYGANLSQLVTDFGRTSALAQSARFHVASVNDLVTLTGAQLKLAVRQAYLAVLGAEAILQAAKAAQASRQLVTHLLTELANNQLRSTLDVNFAAVLESEADLSVVRAKSLVSQQRSRLALAMGEPSTITAALVDISTSPDDGSSSTLDSAALSARAQQSRADLNAARLDQQSAQEYAKAEQKLRLPTLQVLGAAGQIPFHDHTLQDNYAAAGFNLSVPIFNGGLFRARQAEANLEANARAQDVTELSLEISQQVRDAMTRLEEARQAFQVSQRLVTQSKEALHLAQARYDNGLGSIVELNEAQNNESSAEINAADARYTYLSLRADLDFVSGALN